MDTLDSHIVDIPPSYNQAITSSNNFFNHSLTTTNNDKKKQFIPSNTIYKVSKSGWFKRQYTYFNNDNNKESTYKVSYFQFIAKYLENEEILIQLNNNDYNFYFNKWQINFLNKPSEKYQSIEMRKRWLQMYPIYEIKFILKDFSTQIMEFRGNFFGCEWEVYKLPNNNNTKEEEKLLLKYNLYLLDYDKLVIYEELDEEDLKLICLIFTFILEYQMAKNHHNHYHG